MIEVMVVNRNPKVYKDKYVGMEFIFNPGEKVSIPLPAAVHFFAFGKNDKTSAWSRRFSSKEEGESWLSKFDLTSVELVPKEEVEELTSLKVSLDGSDAIIKKITAENEKLASELDKMFVEYKKMETQVKELTAKLESKGTPSVGRPRKVTKQEEA